MLLASPLARAYPDAPSTWGTWHVNTYTGLSPRHLSAATDPDGRLRLCFINDREIPGGPANSRQVLVTSWRRGSGSLYGMETAGFLRGLPVGTPAPTSGYAPPEYADSRIMPLPLRTKITSAPRGSGMDTAAFATLDSTLWRSTSSFVNTLSWNGNSTPSPLFPRKPWTQGDAAAAYSTNDTNSLTGSAAASAAGSVQTRVSMGGSAFISFNIQFDWHLGGRRMTTGAIANANLGINLPVGRLHSMDAALTEDGKDCYLLISSTAENGATSPPTLRSGLTVVRQRLTSPTTAGPLTQYSPVSLDIPFDLLPSDNTRLYSKLEYPKILLTRSNNEPKWIVWEDRYNAEIRVARRQLPLPENMEEDPDLHRRINAGYAILPAIDTFAFGVDAALDQLDRLHLVWWNPVGGLIRYARENASGGFDKITLPLPASSAPTIAIGPGNYPYIAYPGAVTSDPSASAPLIITCPPGLITSYHGDYEDQDQDGRCALLERAQGSIDTRAETGLELRALTLTPNVATVGSGKRFEMSFPIRAAATRVGTTTTWDLPDGNDIIRIQPVWSTNGGADFFSGFLSVAEEFTINNVTRYLTIRDTTDIGPEYPAQIWRLHVTRIPGPP